MLKRKAEYDARRKPAATSTPSSSASSPAPSASSSTKPSKPNKKAKLSPDEKSLHHDPSLYLNKQRTLILSSRGILHRDRHLLSDLVDLVPHAKKDNKLDTKHSLDVLNELALLKSCNNILFFEARKHKDLYLWMAKASTGPSVKFLVSDVHTMAEVKLTGNCIKYSRPIIVFDPSFSSSPHLALIRELLHQCFAAPKGHPRVKPFVDHVMAFFYLDSRVWCRHYQIVHAAAPNPPALVEIGPRFVLCPIRVFSGSMGGATLWENAEYVSPNELRAEIKRKQGMEYVDRVEDVEKTRKHKQAARLQEHEVDAVFTTIIHDQIKDNQ